jgi:hypothetical protein
MNWYTAERFAMEHQSSLLAEASQIRRAVAAKRGMGRSALGQLRLPAIRTLGLALAHLLRVRTLS